MKKTCQVAATAIIMCMLAGCGGKNGEATVTLKPEDFESDEAFITIVDATPNALQEDALELYSELGVNTFVLTEDYVPMTEDGALTDSYRKSIQAAGEKGLNVWIRNMWNDPDYFESGTDKTGSNYGSPYQMSARNLTTEFSEFPEVTGFYMADEAYMHKLTDDPATDYDESLFSNFDELTKLIDWKNKYYPNAYMHMNHVPSASYDHWPAGTSYAEFIQYYVDTIVKRLESGGRSICLDNYPLLEGGTLSDTYLTDLLTVANIARDYNAGAAEGQKATYGICLQTFQNTDSKARLRDITSAEDVTFQMYTGMAMGARLFEYFCYRTYDSLGIYGIVDSAGEKRVFDYVKEANERALPFEKVLNSFDYRGLTVSKGKMSGKDDTFGQLKGLLLEDTASLSSVSGRYDTIVGCFRKGDQDGYMAVNYTAPNDNLTNAVMLEFKDCSHALVYTEDGVKDMKLTAKGELRLSLKAGEGAFIIPAK